MRTGRVVVGLSAVVCLAFASYAAPTNPPAVRTVAASAPAYRIIVKLRSADSGDSSAARQQRQARPAREAVSELAARNQMTLVRARTLLPGLQVIDLLPQGAGQSLQAVLARLR